MSYGLQVFNAAGAVRLDVSDRLTRLVYSAEAAASASGSATVAGITEDNAVVTALCVGASGPAAPHEVWITDDTVHWSALPTPSPGSTDFRVASLVLVFRFR